MVKNEVIWMIGVGLGDDDEGILEPRGPQGPLPARLIAQACAAYAPVRKAACGQAGGGSPIALRDGGGGGDD
ncbi:MAG: hypothetical protein N3E51_03195 [Candidatus Micrarchaeota archaeon]|nr:hypothetical protein [Candidatus Micrarchaeota archaeon]